MAAATAIAQPREVDSRRDRMRTFLVLRISEALDLPEEKALQISKILREAEDKRRELVSQRRDVERKLRGALEQRRRLGLRLASRADRPGERARRADRHDSRDQLQGTCRAY